MLNKTITLLLLLFSLSCSAAQTVMEAIPLLNRPASELQPLVAPLLEETDTLVANGFTLIVKTTPARLAEIKALLKKLDTALTDLSIRVMQSKDKTAEQLNAGIAIDVLVPVGNPAEVTGKIKGQYQQNQRQLSSQNTQMLRTLEGQPAYIKTGGNYPIHFSTVYNTGYGQRTASANTQLIEASTGFAVLPRLNGDWVTLEISPWSEQMNGNGSISTQSAQTTLKAKLGQWVEIGTINEESQTTGNGLSSVEQSSGHTVVHILVQVEKAH